MATITVRIEYDPRIDDLDITEVRDIIAWHLLAVAGSTMHDSGIDPSTVASFTKVTIVGGA